MPHPFHPFTHEHFVALAVGAVAGLAFIMAGKRGGGSRRRATALLALLNFSVLPLSLAAWSSVGVKATVDNFLPFQLCDLAAITAGFALVTKRPLLCALTYFWGLAATLQALLTPALTLGFPSAPFLVFFLHHFAVVIAAFYIPLVEGWRPKQPLWKGPLEAYGWAVVYLIFAMAANKLLGSNFAFASAKPTNPSLIDHLGPWPWYLLSMQAIALTFFFLLALPFAGRKREA